MNIAIGIEYEGKYYQAYHAQTESGSSLDGFDRRITRDLCFGCAGGLNHEGPSCACTRIPANSCFRLRNPDFALKLLEQIAIPPAPLHLIFHGGKRFCEGHGFLVRALGGAGIEQINNLEDPSGHGNRIPLESVGISRSV